MPFYSVKLLREDQGLYTFAFDASNRKAAISSAMSKYNQLEGDYYRPAPDKVFVYTNATTTNGRYYTTKGVPM